MNDKLIDALFSVSSRIREIRTEMERLTETDNPKLLAPFKYPDPSTPVTRSGQRRAMEAQEQAGSRHTKPRLISEESVTRFQGEAKHGDEAQLKR